MDFKKVIQYAERFPTKTESDDCLAGLKKLEGYINGRSVHSPSFGEEPFLAQAFFKCDEDVVLGNEGCIGMRVVMAPDSMLKT